jgi:hypothetical protein
MRDIIKAPLAFGRETYPRLCVPLTQPPAIDFQEDPR